MFKALNNEQRDILMDQTENIGKDETINVGMDMANDMQKGGGNWTLNAFKTATINVGPVGHAADADHHDAAGHHAERWPGGACSAQIVMNASGITLSVMGGLTSISRTPAAIVDDVSGHQRDWRCRRSP